MIEKSFKGKSFWLQEFAVIFQKRTDFIGNYPSI